MVMSVLSTSMSIYYSRKRYSLTSSFYDRYRNRSHKHPCLVFDQ